LKKSQLLSKERTAAKRERKYKPGQPNYPIENTAPQKNSKKRESNITPRKFQMQGWLRGKKKSQSG